MLDPMAGKYTSFTPYSYCAGNPVNLVDPTGSDWYSIKNEKGDTEYIYSSSIRSKEDLLQQILMVVI